MQVITDYLSENDVTPGSFIFHEGFGWDDWITKIGTWCRWTHVGLITEIWNRLHVFESVRNPSPGIYDHITGQEKRGIRCVPLTDLVFRNQGIFGIRRLITPLRTKDIKIMYKEYVIKHEIDFEESRSEMIRAACPRLCCGVNLPDFSTAFCSEFVAHLLTPLSKKEMKASNNYIPKSFTTFQFRNRHDYVWEDREDMLILPNFRKLKPRRDLQNGTFFVV